MSLIRRVGTTPPWIIGAIYLLLIPVFALIYTFLWQDFYQATAKYEGATSTFEIQSRQDLRKFLAPWLRGYEAPGFRFKTGDITALSVQGDLVSFVSPMTYTVNLEEQDPQTLHYLMTRDNTHRSFPEAALRGEVTIYPTWTVSLSSTEFKVDSIPAFLHARSDVSPLKEFLRAVTSFRTSAVNPTGQPQHGERILSGGIKLPPAVQESLARFRGATEGFPGPAHGGFGRFVYFSAVTITTLGYGDIVPMTDRARLLVACEAVLGVVLAGLFLNSVASRAGKGN